MYKGCDENASLKTIIMKAITWLVGQLPKADFKMGLETLRVGKLPASYH